MYILTIIKEKQTKNLRLFFSWNFDFKLNWYRNIEIFIKGHSFKPYYIINFHIIIEKNLMDWSGSSVGRAVAF